MRVLVIGRDLGPIIQLLKQEGVEVVEDRPEAIVTHGGDGYLLEAERLYPGVPKLPIRHDSICKVCINTDTSHAIKTLAKGTIAKSVASKLEAKVKGKTYYALNEFSLYHVKPNQAIRFDVQINNDEHRNLVIGDGAIVATPFGSHAYYRSITRGTFRSGIGLAFNNTTEPIDHMVIREEDTVTFTVLRGPAYFISDNDKEFPELEAGESVTIKLSSKQATLLGMANCHCPDCNDPEVTTVSEEQV
jgi:NAD+ kinase